MLRRLVLSLLFVGSLFSPLSGRMVRADDPAPPNAVRAAGRQESSDALVVEKLGLPLQEIEKAYEGTTPQETSR
jgi:hypothetical protein